MSQATPTVLFVYGTLMRGRSGHDHLKGAHYIADAVTQPRYTLLDLGPWPGLWEGGTQAVTGELFLLLAAQLSALDAYEECPIVYRRTSVALAGCDDAQAYFINSRGTWPIVLQGRWVGC